MLQTTNSQVLYFYNECESIQLSNKTHSTFILDRFNFMSKAKVYTIMYIINEVREY